MFTTRNDSPPPDAWSLGGQPSPPPSPPRAPLARFALVDAFSSVPFKGNPAAVVLLAPFGSFPSDASMQALAGELNQSETAFCFRRGDGPGYALRWFTPEREVELCGHATLASAHALVTLQSATLPLSFHTRSGELRVSRDAVGGVLLQMDFPAAPPSEAVPAAAAFLTGALAAALGATPVWVGRADATGDTFCVLDSEEAVRAVVPDFGALRRLGGRGIVVTASATGGAGSSYDFVSRFFAPSLGVDEDPVTGSAHSALGPFWAQRLGKSALLGRQLSVRGGEVIVTVQPCGQRVLLSGRAVTVMHGDMDVPLL